MIPHTTHTTAAAVLAVAPVGPLTGAMLVDRELAAGTIVQCPRCSALNAFGFAFVNVADPCTGRRYPPVIPAAGYADGGEPYSEEECLWLAPETADIYHIPTAGAWEWPCGKCDVMFVEADAPIRAEVYTHAPALAA